MTDARQQTWFDEALRMLDAGEGDPRSGLASLEAEGVGGFLAANLIDRRIQQLLPQTPASTARLAAATARVAATLAMAARLQAVSDRLGVPVVFPKALQHYPDMGHDIDLWTLESAAEFDARLTETFSLTPARRGVFDRVAGKRGYVLAGCPSPLEIHHGGVGHLGEHRGFLIDLLARRRVRNVEGASIGVPSDEDQLIIQALQRMFGHFSVRVSDVHLTATLVRGPLDWDYVHRTSRRVGLAPALSEWLALAGRLWHGAVGREFPALARGSAGHTHALTSRGHLWRLNVVAVAPRLYSGLALHAIRRCQWRTLGRVAALPAAAAAFAILAVGRPVRHALASRSAGR